MRRLGATTANASKFFAMRAHAAASSSSLASISLFSAPCKSLKMCSPLRPTFPLINRRHFRTSRPAFGIVHFNLADVGEGITECEVLKWNIKVGDFIEEFQPICELQSDKANVEVTSRYTGKVTKIHYNVGELAKVHTPLIDIDVDGQKEEETAAPAPTAQDQTTASAVHRVGIHICSHFHFTAFN